MGAVALLGRDFLANPAIKVEIDETLRISQNIFKSPIGNDFIDQILHIDCTDPVEDKVELKVNPNVPTSVVLELEKIYVDAYLTDQESQLPVIEPEMTICLKHEQPITFRAWRVAYADKIKLKETLEKLVKEGLIRESTSPYAR